jgi:integrase
VPCLFKRSNGIYYIRFFLRGKRHAKSTGERLKPRAARALINFELDWDSNKDTLLLSEFQSQLLDLIQSDCSPSTVRIYDRSLSQFQTIAGNICLSSITPLHVDRYKAARLKTISPMSVNIELRALRAAFYRAVRWNLLPEATNPFRRLVLARVPSVQPAYLSRQEFARLLNFVPERWLREILVVAVSTGLRQGELLNLKWTDVDFESATIHVQSREDFQTKAGKQRLVPMNLSTVQILFTRSQEKSNDYVFSIKGRRVEGTFLSHRFKKCVRRAGLSEKLHFHSLRHTFATWLVQQQVPIYDVQKLLGHSSISVTQVYAHLASSELHRAVEKIEIPEN